MVIFGINQTKKNLFFKYFRNCFWLFSR